MKKLVFELRRRFLDRLINYYAPYIGAGVKLTHMSKDFRKARVEMPLTFLNKNYVGTHFGGSLYSMTDPWYMLMLIKNLGPGYIVWDKAATINFRKPGRSRVHAEFELTQEIIDEIRSAADRESKLNWPFKVEIFDEDGVLVADVEKIVYIRKKTEKLKDYQTEKK